jgi:hemoglobin
MDALPQAKPLRAMHARELSATKDMLKRYLGEWMGGPPRYSEIRGHPRLRLRHIGVAERDMWLMCMRGALDLVVVDRVLREELYAAFFKLADWVRNDPAIHTIPRDRHAQNQRFGPVMIICSCNVISDHEVRTVLVSAEANPCSAAQVYDCLGCIVQCGRCARSVRRILEEGPPGGRQYQSLPDAGEATVAVHGQRRYWRSPP